MWVWSKRGKDQEQHRDRPAFWGGKKEDYEVLFATVQKGRKKGRHAQALVNKMVSQGGGGGGGGGRPHLGKI